jgi:hypothetical protein
VFPQDLHQVRFAVGQDDVHGSPRIYYDRSRS